MLQLKGAPIGNAFAGPYGGADGTRTRDHPRDRRVF